MVKIKKIVFVLVFLLSIGLVSAANIGIVVEFPDGTIVQECVGVKDNTNGYDILEKTSLDITWSDKGQWGHALCKISGIGEEVSGTNCAWGSEYWGFFIAENNDWSYSPVGLDTPGDCWNRDFSSYGGHYCAKHGDVLGFAHGAFGTKPIFISSEEICEKLIIDEVTAYVDGDKDKLGEGDKIRDVKPESKLKLKIKVKNLYEEDIEIKDITITAIIKDIDDGDDLEEESDEFDLDAGDSKTETIEFEIPLEVEDGIYDLILEIEGKDDQDVEYSKTYEYSIEVEKEKHDIVITKAELTNPTLKCSRTTTLDIVVINMGTNEEDVVLKVINADLGLNKQLNFELSDDPFDDDSKYSTSFTITVDNDQEAGVYPITVSADYGSKTAEETVELKVEDCKIKEGEEKEEDIIVNIEQEEQESTANSEEITANVVEEVKSDETKEIKNILMISSAVLVYIVIVVGGVALVVRVGKG